ncbi:protein serine/threonine phosphatase [Haliangium ochraceum DSM 14365]|uniref:Protein serine/threonine phosphatase n=1 Tax=Haliangium ochraceum (strain DSM 14365 / JCM 11303 / SMP-2) TaxID=502025 RepID=D0LRP4_HALO1|nr:protein serine/threonine phosphatase [Haliangium ochraceum DSM 14365]
MDSDSVIQQFLRSVQDIEGVVDVVVLDEEDVCVAHRLSQGKDAGQVAGYVAAAGKLKELMSKSPVAAGRYERTSLLIRYERRYLLLRKLGKLTALISAHPHTNLSMISVGFRVFELKLTRPSSERLSAPGIRLGGGSALEQALADPALTRLQALLAKYLGGTSSVLFRNRLRSRADSLSLPIGEEAYGELVNELSRFIRDATQRELFLAHAAREQMQVSQAALRKERDDLRSLVDTVTAGLRICHRISEPVSGAALSSEDSTSNEVAEQVIEYCANNDALLSNHGPQFREDYLRLTDRLLELRRELNEAGLLQRMLVPRRLESDHGFASIAAYFAPSAQCGGDWWTVKDLADGRLLVVLGDVTGHSLSTAIITAVAKAACDVVDIIDTSNAKAACEYVLSRMNASIFDATQSKVLMTCAASILDPHARTVTLSSAGHNFPYLARMQNGSAHLQTLVARGNPLGVKAVLEIETVTAELQDGDLLLWYTDGVTECENDQAEPFGDRRFRRIIRRLVDLEASKVRDTIASAVDNHRAGAPRNDDITFIASKLGNMRYAR